MTVSRRSFLSRVLGALAGPFVARKLPAAPEPPWGDTIEGAMRCDTVPFVTSGPPPIHFPGPADVDIVVERAVFQDGETTGWADCVFRNEDGTVRLERLPVRYAES